MGQETAEEKQLTEYKKRAPTFARERALILKILRFYPDGLTVQQIIQQEIKCYGYSFLTDNRLRELRKQGIVESIDRLGKPQLWRLKPE